MSGARGPAPDRLTDARSFQVLNGQMLQGPQTLVAALCLPRPRSTRRTLAGRGDAHPAQPGHREALPGAALVLACLAAQGACSCSAGCTRCVAGVVVVVVVRLLTCDHPQIFFDSKSPAEVLTIE